RPDKVVRAQHVEGARHLRALEVAALIHLLLEVLDLRLVDEHAELARLREIQQEDEEGRALHAIIFLRREVGECCAEQRSSEAIADEVDLALAGRLLYRVERGERA